MRPWPRPFATVTVTAAVFACASAGPAAAQAQRPFRLCVLDQLTLLTRSRIAQDEAGRFQQLRGQAQTRLDDDRRTLAAQEQAFATSRARLSAQQFALQQQDLDRLRRANADRATQLNQQLGQLDAALTNIVMKAATPAIMRLENDRGCSLLGAKASFLAVNDPSLDITDGVLAQMNTRPPQTSAPQRR